MTHWCTMLWGKITIAFFLLLLTVQLSAQSQEPGFTVIGRNDSLSVTAIRTDYPVKYFLLVKTNRKVDSLFFNDDSNDYLTDTCIISAKQLDGKGSPEIILEHRRHFETPHGKYYDVTTTQIWNRDTRQMLFTGNNLVSYVGSQFETDSTGEMYEITWTCDCRYDIEFNAASELVIRNLKIESEGTDCESDHKEGTYVLINGQYVRKGEK